MKKYSMGIDYGTLSCRGVIVDLETGAELASAVSEYSHGVISETFLDGTPLPSDFALQHPADYIESLCKVTRRCISVAGINPADIIGIGVDFTACTLIPTDENLTPLCFLDEFKNRPHAYAKLWKHHAAQPEADLINRIAKDRGEAWLSRYGGTVSCEWLLPKVMEVLDKDEEIYNRAYRFIEAGDWIVSQLTGKENHSLCQAGFKALFGADGYPSDDFLASVDQRLVGLFGSKVSGNISPLSSDAGTVCPEIAAMCGLSEETHVSPSLIDAHAALPALGVTEPGALLMILGTSTCHILIGDKEINIPGICGYVHGGIYDGIYAYEAGQSAVGDCFEWFVKNSVPHKYYLDAEEKGIGIHKYLREKAMALPAGSGGIIALDWWNGNRTPYVDGALSGTIIGLNLTTAPEQIYRAMIEATAFGTRRIVELYKNNGIEIKQIFAAGGIAIKDPMLMQIYADVLGVEIKVPTDTQSCAYGSALLGAVCQGGFGSLQEASTRLKKPMSATYTPRPEQKQAYDKFYSVYCEASAYFAEENRAIMSFLKNKKDA